MFPLKFFAIKRCASVLMIFKPTIDMIYSKSSACYLSKWPELFEAILFGIINE